MRKIVTTYALLATAFSCLNGLVGQSPGYVYKQNRGKKPVPGVMLQSYLTNQVYTDNNGLYSLIRAN